MKKVSLYVIVTIVLFSCSEPARDAGHEHTTATMKGNDQSGHLMLTDTQIRLANITTQRVVRGSIGQTVTINGRLAVDERKTEIISSRVAGRIERLFIKETGRQINQGQALYVLYSEDLLTFQQEYLLAKEQYELLGKTGSRYKSFVDAAEKKLLLYGLTGNQIARLSRETLEPRITFLATTPGIVTEINASEGQYVNEGSPLYKVDDISSLWVEADLYPNETSLVAPGDKVKVRIVGSGVDALEAIVTFMSPQYRNNSQIVTMRAEIDNPDNRFKPGQHAQVVLTHSPREGIAIPADAVIRGEHGTHAYVQTGHNTFQARRVETGMESFDHVEITGGLKEGDTIAVSGAYLLYSEMILKKGTDPMEH